MEKDDAVINLRDEKLHSYDVEPVKTAEAEVSDNKVKVKFEKFANLVATHAYEEIIDEHKDDYVIISTDLLADLANAHEEGTDKRIPLMFVLGGVLGIIITWFLISY